MLNARAEQVVARLERRRPRPDPAGLHPEDQPIDLSSARALVLGMGRVGSAAHHRLAQHHGMSVRGVESDAARVRRLRSRGVETIEADATDEEFWQRVAEASQVEIAVLAMPFHGSNLRALASLRRSGFRGRVAAVAQYDDEAAALVEHGADVVLQIYDGAGAEVADLVIDRQGT